MRQITSAIIALQFFIAPLAIAADSTTVTITPPTYFGWLWQANGTPTGLVSFNGVAQAQVFLRSSDETLKTHFHEVDNTMDIVRAVDTFQYDWLDSGRPGYGFKAQDLVPYAPRGTVFIGSNGTIVLDDTGLIAILWTALKQNDIEVQALKLELEAIRSQHLQ